MNRKLRRWLDRRLKKLVKAKAHASMSVEIHSIEVVKPDGSVIKYGGK